MYVILQLFRLQENHMSLIQAYQLKENELESYRRLLEMHGIWVSCKLYNINRCDYKPRNIEGCFFLKSQCCGNFFIHSKL